MQNHSIRILVVDDNYDVRRFVVHIITVIAEQQPIDIAEAETGDQALQMMQQAAAHGRPYRIILTDIHMPGMKGHELYLHARRDLMLRTASQPLWIAMSSENLDPEGLAMRNEGVPFIYKGALEDFLQVLQPHLKSYMALLA
jgi:CheY-like chemotaxis protein